MTCVAKVLQSAWHESYGPLSGFLFRYLKNADWVEDVLQDTAEKALSVWQKQGVPQNPASWLSKVARNKAIDQLRLKGNQTLELEDCHLPMCDDDFLDVFGDDLLRLIFTCCHPQIDTQDALALTLKLVLGFSTEAVSKALLLKTKAAEQKLTRAKKKIKQLEIGYEVPESKQLEERLQPVLLVIYLMFNEGYLSSEPQQLIRQSLCEEAIKLTRAIQRLKPNSHSSKALLALLLLQHARRASRLSSQGELVTLENQDRCLWDNEAIREGLSLVEQALSMAPAEKYGLEAAIAALHCQASTFDDTDWPQILALYNLLSLRYPSDVVSLNRIIPLQKVEGSEKAWVALERLGDSGLSHYYLFYVLKGRLLKDLGHNDQAQTAFQQAIDLTQNQVEKRHIKQMMGAS